jgi:WD40 repeat protein
MKAKPRKWLWIVVLMVGFIGGVTIWQGAIAADSQTTPEPTITPQSCYNDRIYDVAFSPDSQSILTTWEPGQVRLWKTDTGDLIRTFDDSNRDHQRLAFSPDGNTILTGGITQAILWDVHTGAKLHEFPRDIEDAYGTSVMFAPDGQSVVTGGRDGASVWDVQSGDKLHSFSGQPDQSLLQYVQISSNGQYLVTMDAGGLLVYMWDVNTGEKLHTFDDSSTGIFSPDSQYIVTFDYQRLVLWDLATFQTVYAFDVPGTMLSHWEFSEDGQYFLAAIDGQFILWDVPTGKRLLQFPIPLWENVYGILPDSEHIVMPQAPSAENQKQYHVVDVWDIRTGAVTKTFSMGDNEISAFQFSRDGRYVVIGTVDGEVQLWDIQQGEMIRQFCE